MFIWSTFSVGLASAATGAHDVVVVTMSPATTVAVASALYVAITIVASPPKVGNSSPMCIVVRRRPNPKSPPTVIDEEVLYLSFLPKESDVILLHGL